MNKNTIGGSLEFESETVVIYELVHYLVNARHSVRYLSLRDTRREGGFSVR